MESQHLFNKYLISATLFPLSTDNAGSGPATWHCRLNINWPPDCVFLTYTFGLPTFFVAEKDRRSVLHEGFSDTTRRRVLILERLLSEGLEHGDFNMGVRIFKGGTNVVSGARSLRGSSQWTLPIILCGLVIWGDGNWKMYKGCVECKWKTFLLTDYTLF